MFVFGQPFQGRRDRLGDSLDRVGDAREMRGQPVEEVARGVYRRSHQQRFGAGKVPVDGLSGDTERAGDVGDGEVGAALVDRLACRGQDACHGLLVSGRC